jgi:F-type H+-transporting ATPase subunit beta
MANVTYGEVTQVIGAVVDIRFKPGELPDLMSAITIKSAQRKPAFQRPQLQLHILLSPVQ